MIPFGQALYLWRVELGLTQQEFARRAGIPRPNLSAIERGKREVSLGTLRALAAALEIRPGILADGIPPASQEGTLLSREALERIADAIVHGNSLPNKAESELAELIRQVISHRLTRGRGKASSAFQSGKRKKNVSWLLLESRYPSEVLKSLLQRVSEKQSSHEPTAD